MIPVIQLLGGEGKRLKEITNGKIPKPLIKINNNSILEIQIKHLISFGFKDFIWVCHFMHELFIEERERLLEKYEDSLDSITIFKERSPLSTFGSIKVSIEYARHLNNEDKNSSYLVLYGDILFGVDFYRFVENFKLFKNSDIHILTRYSNHPKDSDKIFIDNNGYIKKFISKKESFDYTHPSTTTTGIYLAKKSFFEKLSNWSNQKCDLFSEVLPFDANLVVASAYHSTEFILDIGTKERFLKGQKALNENMIFNKSYLNPQRALILDRDGVIIKENGHLTEIKDIEYNEKLIEVLRILRSNNVLVGIITNQPHVAQGRINLFEFNNLKNEIIRK